METFTKLFGSLLFFVYHCFDRIVINGYLSGLTGTLKLTTVDGVLTNRLYMAVNTVTFTLQK